MALVCTSVPRERLGIFAIEAELCPYVLSNILRIVAVSEAVTFTIHVRRYPHMQKVELETGADGDTVMRILHQLRRLAMVRHARLVSLAERAASAVPRATI